VNKRRARKGPVAAAKLLAKVTNPAFRRQGFVESEVLLRWPAIVGPELARLATPEKLTFTRGSPAGGVLHVRAAGAAGVEVQHLAPTVIERVNSYYGYRAVARVHIVQAPLTRNTEQQAKTAAKRALSTDERRRLDAALAATDNPRLKAALARLGAQVLAHDPDPAPGRPAKP